MIDWVLVLAGLGIGVSVFAARAARQETLAHPTTRLFVWLVPVVGAGLAVAGAGVEVWSAAGGRLDLQAARAQSLPGPVTTAGQPPAATALPFFSLAPPVNPGAEPGEQFAPRLRIPALNVDLPIDPMPLRDGHWDITTLGAGIGWLEGTGARPGADLAMVFIGHVNVSMQQHGPFAELQHLPLGAALSYTLNGQEYLYTVVEKGRMTTEDVSRVYLPAGDTLLLLTCTDWEPDTRTYARRLLVRAVRAAGPLEAGAP